MPQTDLHRPVRRLARRALPALAALGTVAALAAPASAGTYTGEVAFGPNGALRSLANIDLAPDGTGAMAFTVEEGGADHVYVSRLLDGAWQGAERVDGDLPGPSSQPVVAAGDRGRVTVAFVNGGNVYASTRPSFSEGWRTETVWGSGGASDPHVDLSVNRKGYLAFAAPGAGGHDLRVAYSRDAGPWQVIGAPLDADPNNDAGVGTGRARVGASADGVAVIAWGEAGHVRVRRVAQMRPSVVVNDATAGTSIENAGALGSDLPEVGIQDDDSFTGIAYRGTFDLGGGTTRTRAVFRRLRGSRLEWLAGVDTTSFAAGDGSGGPRIATTGVGQGLVTAGHLVSNLSSALPLRADVAPTAPVQLDTVAPSTAPAYAVPAASTQLKQLVAWQYTAPDGARDIRWRFYDGTAFGPEEVASVAALGTPDAARGLDAAADDHGDMVVAWVQDQPGQGAAIATATIDQPPVRFAPLARTASFERTDRPVLRWSRSREFWGATYRVTIDGVEAGTTRATSFRPATPLGQGVHSWQVTVTDRRGQSFAAKTGTIRVDSVAPTASVALSGPRRSGQSLRLTVRASDAAPPAAPGAAVPRTSGIAAIVLDWGDRSRRERVRAGSRHVYARPGRYTIRLTLLDKAGNRAVVRQPVVVRAPPRPRRRAARRGARA